MVQQKMVLHEMSFIIRSIANNNSIFFKALYAQRLHDVNRGDLG